MVACRPRVLAAVLGLVLALPALLLFAATATLVPDGDKATAAWGAEPLWSKIAEDIDSPDGVVITSPGNPSPSNTVEFDVTCPADVGLVTGITARLRAREQGKSPRSISLSLRWTPTGTTNIIYTGNLKAEMTDYNRSQRGMKIDKAACDASTLSVIPNLYGTGPGEFAEIDTINLDLTYTTPAGAVRAPVHLSRRQP